MENLTTHDTAVDVGVKFGSCSKVIRGYPFLYSIMDFDIKEKLRVAFPSFGYIILNFYSGDTFQYYFSNYNFPKSQNHHLYIMGLFSESPLIMEADGRGRGFAMKLHPVVGYHLLREPMEQLCNQQCLINNIINRGSVGSLISSLEKDQQLNIFNNNYLEHFLLSAFPDRSVVVRDPIYQAVNTIIQRRGMIRIKDLADHYCMSIRTLNRQFLLKVGMSPKSYAKIWQRQYVTQLLQRSCTPNLPELAYQTGYYDSAHLVRDFKDKVLQTPAEFQKDIHPLIQDYLNFPQSLE